MFNPLHPERVMVVGCSSSQPIHEVVVTGKNKSNERERDSRRQEVRKPPCHFIGKGQLQGKTGGHWEFFFLLLVHFTIT